MYIVGEPRTPAALRNASDQFFEWVAPEAPAELAAEAVKVDAPMKAEPARTEPAKPLPKRRPRSVVDAVTLLASDTSEGSVNLGALGSYLRRADPAFSSKTYGHSGLLDMVKTYDLTQRPAIQVSSKRNGATGSELSKTRPASAMARPFIAFCCVRGKRLRNFSSGTS